MTDTAAVPDWVDLSTPDVEAAARFYGELLGWRIEANDSPVGEYHIGEVGGREVGGMMASAPEQDVPPAWTVLFRVADVDTAVDAAEAAGGVVLEPAFDLPDSRIAILADPSGAVFGVVRHPDRPGPWLSTAPGAVCWVELLTRDHDAAVDFYTRVFGWESTTEIYGYVSYTVFRADGADTAGAMAMPDEVPAEAPSSWSVSFAVADCTAAAQRAEELGGLVAKPPTPVGEGHFAVIADPQGATFQLMDHTP
jgi:uncharacterized protein